MDGAGFIGFLAASIVFIAIPGPNVALICSHSLAHGLRYGLLTVAGISAAMAVQLAIVVLGAGALLSVAGWFLWVRWLGVAYLLYLGIRSWMAAENMRDSEPPETLSRAALLRGFFVSLTNVHTLLFFAAFLPQFVDPTREALPQLAILGTIFLVFGIVLDGVWAVIAARMRRTIAAHSKLRSRLTGMLLIIAAAALAISR